MGGGHCGDSDEEAQMPDTLSALVKVSSLKNEINKLVMECVRKETVQGDVSFFPPPPTPPLWGRIQGGMDCSD